MENIAYVPYEEPYLESVRRTYNHFIDNTTVTFDLESYTPEQMRQLIEPLEPIYRSFVILWQGQYAGYVLITQHKKRPAYRVTAEVTIYLDAEYAGRGIGAHAIPYMEKVARQQGIHTLIATICGENTGSIRLFEKLGYEKCAHYKEVGYKFERWLDLVAYQKIL